MFRIKRAPAMPLSIFVTVKNCNNQTSMISECSKYILSNITCRFFLMYIVLI